MKLYPVDWFQTPSSNFEIFSSVEGRQGAHFGDVNESASVFNDYDEIVHVDGHEVVWSAGHGASKRIYKSCRQVLTVKQALLCSFVGVGNSSSGSSLGITSGSCRPETKNGAVSGQEFGGLVADSKDLEASVDTPFHEDDRCMCVLQGAECIKVYAPDGAEFEVALPCRAERMWALPRGLLIKRAVTSSTNTVENVLENNLDSDSTMDEEISKSSTSGCLDIDDDKAPMYFSLLHPLEELKPVSYSCFNPQPSSPSSVSSMSTFQAPQSYSRASSPICRSATGMSDTTGSDIEAWGDFLCDPKEKIVAVDRQLYLAVTHNDRKKAHTVWALLPSSAIKKYENLTKPSTTTPTLNNSLKIQEIKANTGEGLQNIDNILEDASVLKLNQRTDCNGKEAVGDLIRHSAEDNDDNFLESEVCMKQVWINSYGDDADPADAIFVAHDAESSPLLCFVYHKRKVLRALSIKPEVRSDSSAGSANHASSARYPSCHMIVDFSYELECLSAQPICATGERHTRDIIVLTLGHDLHLYRGSIALCSLTVVANHIPNAPTVNFDRNPCRNITHLGVRRLEHAVSNRVNLVLENGSILRVATKMEFHSSLVRRLLNGLDFSLPADLTLGLRVDVAYWCDYIQHCEDPDIRNLVNVSTITSGFSRTGSRVDIEWVAFVTVIAMLLMSKDNHDERVSSAKVPGGNAAEPFLVNSYRERNSGLTDRFAELLASDYHREYEQDNLVLARSFSPAKGCSECKAETPYDLNRWYQPLWRMRDKLISEPNRLRANLQSFILSVHLIYEEIRLSHLTEPLMRPVSCFLSGFIKATTEEESCLNYTDYYLRDVGVIDSIEFPYLNDDERIVISHKHPPDVLLWITQRMKKANSICYQASACLEPTTSNSIMQKDSMANVTELTKCKSGLFSGAAAISGPFPELELCIRTQQLCFFFDLLSGGSGDAATSKPLDFRLSRGNRQDATRGKSPIISAIVAMDSSFFDWLRFHGYEARNYAERTVLGMVWFGFSLLDLETLSFGISIPLREILHSCRENPSGSWPADAYVLIGREDMAALALAPIPDITASTFRGQEAFGEPDLAPTGLHKLDSPRKFGASASEVDTRMQDDTAETGRLPQRSRRPTPIGSTNLMPEVNLLSPTAGTCNPMWRRSSRGTPNQAAEDILWGSKSLRSKHMHDEAFPTYSHSRGLNSTVSCRLLSIADFARLSASASAEVGSGMDIVDSLIDSDDLTEGREVASKRAQGENGVGTAVGHSSGFDLLQRISSLLFCKDHRIREVCRLLRSSTPVQLVIENAAELSDHEAVVAQQARLLLLAQRTMSLPVGRGMITLGTVRPLLTDTIEIPPLSLSGRLSQNSAVIKLDLSSLPDGDQLLAWPSFHNGVAAGLRLAASLKTTPLTRTWIAYNRPESPNFTHAGVLLALGLHGHLAAVTMADVYEYLSQGHDATTVSILIGLGASCRSTMTPVVSRMLLLHIPSLLPSTFFDMEVPAVVQAAALFGVGLLYQGTGHRLMTEFLLAEIGRRPANDRFVDLESYSLSAGLALGMVCLGVGSKKGGLSGLSDLNLEDRLHRHVVGGLDANSNSSVSTSAAPNSTRCSRFWEGPYLNVNVTSPGATLALALIFLKSGNESVAARLAVPDTHFLLDYVRPDLLMLRVIARGLVLWDTVQPTNEWILSQVPDAILKSFNSMPDDDMVSSSMQNFASRLGSENNLCDRLTTERELSENRENVEMEVDSVKSDSISLDQPSFESSSKKKTKKAPKLRAGNIDQKSIRQAYANITAGACFALGLCFAGTANEAAKRVLSDQIRAFSKMRIIETKNSSTAEELDSVTLEACLGISAIGLAMVMAGTGDLETLKLLRSLRFKVDETVSYGNHMVIGSAIGLLFLGGGRYTLSNSNSAIAALLCAFYPMFPISTNDNQYHLQAVRHLYVLAAEQRCLDIYDVDARSPCPIPIEIELRPDAMRYHAKDSFFGSSYKVLASDQLPPRDETLVKDKPIVMKKVAPCLLPPISWISAIRTASSRYWSIEIDFDGENRARGMSVAAYRVLCVKRKVGHLSYMEDPKGVSSLLTRPHVKSINPYESDNIPSNEKIGRRLTPELMPVFTADPHVLAFAKYLCSFDLNGLESSTSMGKCASHGTTSEAAFAAFCQNTLYDCLTNEKPEILNSMIDIYQTAKSFKYAPHALHVRNVRMLMAFYVDGRFDSDDESDFVDIDRSDSKLLSISFLAYLNRAFKMAVSVFDENVEALHYYVRTLSFPPMEMLRAALQKYEKKNNDDDGFSVCNPATLFATYLYLNSIPGVDMISSLKSDKMATLKNYPLLAQRYRGIVNPEALYIILEASGK